MSQLLLVDVVMSNSPLLMIDIHEKKVVDDDVIQFLGTYKATCPKFP